MSELTTRALIVRRPVSTAQLWLVAYLTAVTDRVTANFRTRQLAAQRGENVIAFVFLAGMALLAAAGLAVVFHRQIATWTRSITGAKI